MKGKGNKIAKSALRYAILILLAVLWIVPIITLILTAVKAKADFISGLSLFEIPEKIAWSNFSNAMTQGRLFKYILNP